MARTWRDDDRSRAVASRALRGHCNGGATQTTYRAALRHRMAHAVAGCCASRTDSILRAHKDSTCCIPISPRGR
ncbi:hypothetical protein, partial [Xanthomonas sacchari]|uniref:hypothetical protein n=1 Tax=Xanthomonas sacchari TaxID=56458 RepID=UPI002258AAE0